MSFELLSFGWLFFNVIVIECMHKEMWNLFHDIRKCALLTHCGNDIPRDSTIFLCAKIPFFFFLQRVKSKVGRKLPPARNSTSVDFKSKGLFVAVELFSQKKKSCFLALYFGLSGADWPTEPVTYWDPSGCWKIQRAKGKKMLNPSSSVCVWVLLLLQRLCYPRRLWCQRRKVWRWVIEGKHWRSFWVRLLTTVSVFAEVSFLWASMLLLLFLTTEKKCSPLPHSSWSKQNKHIKNNSKQTNIHLAKQNKNICGLGLFLHRGFDGIEGPFSALSWRAPNACNGYHREIITPNHRFWPIRAADLSSPLALLHTARLASGFSELPKENEKSLATPLLLTGFFFPPFVVS